MSEHTLLQIVTVLLGSTVIGAILANYHKTRLKRKELIAGATRSALRRVEMYYRILRRSQDDSDDTKLRDLFHDIQEENDYYKSLLAVEAAWLGASYLSFINALKRETMPKIQQAWDGDALGPSARLENVQHPNVQQYINQFAIDSRRFFNPLMRVVMRLKYMLRRHIKDDGYGTH